MTPSKTDSLLDCLSPSDLKQFGLAQLYIILGFPFLSLLLYIVLKIQPAEVITQIFGSDICKLVFAHLKFDHDYFLISTNAESAPRVWITEFLIVALAVGSVILITLLIWIFWMQGKFDKQRLPTIRLNSGAHVASIFLIAFICWMLASGFSRALILGHYQRSFGPNDLAIWFFVMELGCLVSFSTGIVSFFWLFFYSLASLMKGFYQPKN